MEIDHGALDDNEVVRLVVEDTIDANGNGMYRTVYGLRTLKDTHTFTNQGLPVKVVWAAWASGDG